MSPARQNVFVGIDVAKDWLDIAVRPTGAAWPSVRMEAEPLNYHPFALSSSKPVLNLSKGVPRTN